MKFFEKEEYLEDFLNGKLYLNRLSYFINIEEENYSNRYDKYESALCWLQPEKMELQLNGHTFNSNDFVEPILIQKNASLNLNILSLYAGHSGEFKSLSKESLSNFKENLMVNENNNSLGTYAAIIYKTKEFIERVKQAVIENKFAMTAGLIDYYDPVHHHGFFSEHENIFKKRLEFKEQQEYRFAIDTNTKGDNPLTLEVGQMKDIASECNITDFNKNIQIKFSS